MHYLLDTNIFIAALKAQPAVRLRLESLPASALVLSPIVLGELQTGVEKSAQAERNRARLEEVVAGLAVPPLDAATSSHYARIRAGLFNSIPGMPSAVNRRGDRRGRAQRPRKRSNQR